MSTYTHDNEQPPTAAVGSDETAVAPGADETEIVAPPPVAGPELAWSRADDNETGGSWEAAAERASIILLAAVGLAVVVGLSIWLGFYLHDQTRPTPASAVASPVTITQAAVSPPITAAPPPVAAPPPSTVTVTPAPPATLSAEASPPTPRVHDSGAVPPPGGTHVFTICPDGHEGVVGGHTSCAFAANVRQIFYASGMSNHFTAYSPVTGDGYEMTCAGRYPAYFSDGSTTISTRCYGGENAEVVIW
ncbi:hypothetical protein [Mycobacterium sp. 94-17]|uniref:hypothetical protein n=1 Tax=Mycobacterium sp. 94-17 TaxID=2986147 RepID=UPI002D79769A|nr:hypothetical protein [Mycobacterium sp. 94-17]